jgi:hypothetical protein
MTAPCTVDGCGHLSHGHGLCHRHYKRWRQRGEPGIAGLERRENGLGTPHLDGYWRFHLPTHPLADSTGTVLRHRVVLYDALDGADADCHWCGKSVAWGIDLHVDHLDSNRANDERVNLVPSCPSCNSSRVKVRGSKLSEADAEIIRSMVAGGMTKVDVAREFGVSDVMVGFIVRGKAWATPAWRRTVSRP